MTVDKQYIIRLKADGLLLTAEIDAPNEEEAAEMIKARFKNITIVSVKRKPKAADE